MKMRNATMSSLALAAAAIVGLAVSAEAVHGAVVAQWSFENNLNDTSGQGNNGTLSAGSATYVTGAFGQGISLATAQSVNNMAASSLPTAGTAAWSQNIWFNLSSAPSSLTYLAGFGASGSPIAPTSPTTGGDARGFLSYGGAGNDFYYWNNPQDLDSGVAYVANNTWHMYTIVSSGGASPTISMYLDGAFLVSATKTLYAAPSELHVGGESTWNQDFTGKADEYSVWDQALTSTQIGSLFTSNSIGEVPEPTSFAVAGIGGLVLALRRRRAAR